MKDHYVIQVDKKWFMKYHCRIGLFHGVLYLTTDLNEARLFSRASHAQSNAGVIKMRWRTYDFEKKRANDLYGIIKEPICDVIRK